MMTNATSYDVLVGDIVLYLMGFVLDFWEEIISYNPRWQSRYGHQFQLHVQYFSQGVELVGGVTMLVGFANTLPCELHYELCFCSMPCLSLLHSFFTILVIGPCESNKDKNGPLGVKNKNQQWHT